MTIRTGRFRASRPADDNEQTLVWHARTKSFSNLAAAGGVNWEFVPGPIQLNELTEAYALGKRAIVVFLLIHVAARIRGGIDDGWVTLPRRELLRFGVDSAAKARAIAALEKVGLVQVQRQGHRSLRVRLLKIG